MHYELHVTVTTTDIEKFKSDCYSIGVKPIVIETENRDKLEYQVMTSSKYDNENYMFSLGTLVKELGLMGYTVIRQKVEIQPGETKHKDHIYYESHLRLKIPYFFDFNPYKAFFIKEGWHLSKNAFKKNENDYYQMLTYRTNTMELAEFTEKVKTLENYLGTFDIVYDKVEIEECVYDSNVSVDATWLAKQ